MPAARIPVPDAMEILGVPNVSVPSAQAITHNKTEVIANSIDLYTNSSYPPTQAVTSSQRRAEIRPLSPSDTFRNPAILEALFA